MKNVRGKVKKAIIPMAGMGTRFLPFSKILPKELWPLVDKPIIQYIIEEIKASGIKEIIFIKNPRGKISSDY
ncbi:MAG: UTP--glucose-1-phosphate uridylyltransferase, partial [Candidatus Nealsonbacteria bacterium CG07_land_8_20_14_0_80_39_13]